MRYSTSDGDEEYGGDLFDYRELLHERGIETDFREIKGASLFAGAASGATLAFVRSWYRYVTRGTRDVEPLAMSFGDGYALYWPEFASYLSLLGPTLKTELRFAFGQSDFGGLPKSNIRMSYERALPTGTEENGLGVSISLPRIAGISFRLGFAAYRNPAHNGEWREYEAEAASFGSFSIGARLSEGNSYTFRRERVGTAFSFVREREKHTKIFARVAFLY